MSKIYTGIVLIIGLLVAVITLLKVHANAVQSAYNNGYEAGYSSAKDEQLAALQAKQVEMAAINSENQQLTRNYLAIQRKLITARRTFSQERDRYETEIRRSNRCNLPIGIVQQINQALAHRSDTITDTDRRILESEKGELSTVTSEAFGKWCEGLAFEFTEARIQLNTLIDVVGKN